jgi:hypothetical protein
VKISDKVLLVNLIEGLLLLQSQQFTDAIPLAAATWKLCLSVVK